MPKEIVLKKNILGGFNRKQVIDCISMLKSDCVAPITADELHSKLKQIELINTELQIKENKIKELQQQLNDINGKTCSASASLSEATRTVTKAKNDAQSINHQLRCDIKNRNNKIEQIFTKINNINKEIDRIKNSLISTDNKLSDISISNTASVSPTVVINESQDIMSPTIDEVIYPEIDVITTATTEETQLDIITIDSEHVEETKNSIDNFFDELYKMTNGKLFEPRKKLPDNLETSDDFEYEY